MTTPAGKISGPIASVLDGNDVGGEQRRHKESDRYVVVAPGIFLLHSLHSTSMIEYRRFGGPIND